MNRTTVLDGLGPNQATPDPYPHVVVENAIDPELCRKLIDEFPPLSVCTGGRKAGDNVKFYYPARRALGDPRVSATWKEFLRAHLTAEFFAQFIHVFGAFVEEEYPELERTHGRRLAAFRPGVAGRDDFRSCDVLLDALIGVQTPVSGAPRLERRPHVKGHDKFIDGFLYLRADDDSATGGDFEFFSVKPGARPRFGNWAQTNRRHLDLARTVPYGKGTLVMALNTRRSILALTARGPGTRPLMYANFTMQTSRRLFDLDYTLYGRTHRYLRQTYDKMLSS
jgi:hypothetical protein